MLFSLLVFVSYLIMNFHLLFSGRLKSISQSYYQIEHRWMFQAMIWVQGVSFAIVGNTLLFYIAGALLILVALFPTIRNEKHLIWHMIGAIGSIVIGFISIGFDYGNWHAVIVMAWACIASFLMFRNYILVIEEVAYYIIWIALIIEVYHRNFII